MLKKIQPYSIVICLVALWLFGMIAGNAHSQHFHKVCFVGNESFLAGRLIVDMEKPVDLTFNGITPSIKSLRHSGRNSFIIEYAGFNCVDTALAFIHLTLLEGVNVVDYNYIMPDDGWR